MQVPNVHLAVSINVQVALQVASMLNGQPMGGKRRSAYHYDLWCLKYLPKFKWETLTEDICASSFLATRRNMHVLRDHQLPSLHHTAVPVRSC